MTVLQGECLGGSTVVNNAACFRMPDTVKENWISNFDMPIGNIDQEYDPIERELHIQPLGKNGINQRVSEKFIKAVEGYNSGTDPSEQLSLEKAINVNHLNNTGDGNWNLGNKRMRKRSMLETYIPWSEARGVKYVANMTAVRFVCSQHKNRADQVILRMANGSLKTIKIRKAIVIAGGAIASSHFLTRSQINNQNIGQQLSCNFAFPVAFDFPDELKAFDGDQITMAALDPKSRSAFETYFNPPAAFYLSSVPFFFDKRDAWMNRYGCLLNFGSLIGSDPGGKVLKKADPINGQSFSWELGENDVKNIRYAIETLISLGKKAGATKAIIPTKPGIELELTDEKIAAFLDIFRVYPLRLQDIYIGTAHPQGGNLMAGNRSIYRDKRVVTENFSVEGFENVFIADASIFPTSITINPQWTIMALSALAVKEVVKKFEQGKE